METIEPLKVGIVGCGYQGNRLASAIKLTDSLVVTDCMDINPLAASELAASVGGVSVHPSLEDLLGRSSVDVVMVATPHHVLAEISLKAIQAGKHVLAEKPIALNDRQAGEIEHILTTRNICYTAGYSFRYLPAWQKTKDLLIQGVVGEILAIKGVFGTGPLNDDWIARPETGGGPLLFVGSHLIDQVLWYLQDDPVEVYAKVSYRSDTLADEISAFQIRFTGGENVQLLVTQAVPSMVYRLDIYGREGMIHLQPCGFLDYELTVSSKVVEEFEQTSVIHPEARMDPGDYMHLYQLNDFVEAIKTGKQPPITISDGRRVLKIIDAVFESNQIGNPVNIT